MHKTKSYVKSVSLDELISLAKESEGEKRFKIHKKRGSYCRYDN